MADLDDDELLTDDAPPDGIGGSGLAPPWVILAVDDDAGVRAVSAAALSEVRFRDRPLVQLHAASAAEARAILARQPDIAVMLLDVVMESEDSGLQLVRYVREVLGNHNLRIVLRTGQPGAAPESDVIFDYDIDDYTLKTELTAQKLVTVVIMALRAYEQLAAKDANILAFLEDTKHGILIHRDFKPLFANRTYARLLGFDSVDEILALPSVERLIEPAEWARAAEQYLRTIEGVPQIKPGRYWNRRRDGSVLWIETSSVRADWQGAPASQVWVTDVTAEVMADLAAARHEARLSAAFAASPDGIVLVDAAGAVVGWSDRLLDLLELPPNAVAAGRPFALILERAARRGDFGGGDPAGLAAAEYRRLFGADARVLETTVRAAVPRMLEVRVQPRASGGWIAVYTDITERKRAEAELAERAIQIRVTLDAMADGIVMHDRDLNLLVWNDRFRELFDLPAALFEDRPNLERIVAFRAERGDFGPSETEGTVEAALREVRRQASGISRRERLPAPGGRSVELRMSPLPDGGLVRVYTDVTETVRTAAALEASRNAAEAGAQAKSAFLAAMSHEIRTPMNGILGLLELIQQTPLNGEQSELFAVVRQSATALLTIIDDILDFSKIEAGKLEIEAVALSMLDLIEPVAELLATRAEEKGLELVTRVDPAVPAVLSGDPVRLRQILLNLAGNAIKFTERGHVTIAVALEALEAERAVVRIDTIDTGIGLTARQLDQLFEPFTQGDASTTRRYGGTGLGLSISRRLARIMGGEIGAVSEPGAGSTFWCQIPLERVPADAPDDRRRVPDLGGLRVLLMTPNEIQRDALTAGLAPAGVEVLSASSVQALWQALDRAGGTIDVIVLDERLDRGGAASLGGALRRDPRSGAAGLVLLTAFDRLAHVGAAAAGVFAARLARPVRREALHRAVAVAAGRLPPEATAAAPAQAVIDGFAAPDEPTAAAAGAVILVAEDNPTNQLVVRKQMTRLGYVADITADGIEAWEAYTAHPERYGLLLTDCHMPIEDGFRLTARVRAAEAGRAARLPIVALTANALAGQAEACLAAGMDDFISKPVEIGALDQAIRRWLPRAAALRRASAPERAASPPDRPLADAPQAIDLKRLATTLGDDDPGALKEFLTSCIDQLPAAVERVRAALAAENREELRYAGHTARGAAVNLAAMQLAAVLQRVEDGARGLDWAHLGELVSEAVAAAETARRAVHAM